MAPHHSSSPDRGGAAEHLPAVYSQLHAIASAFMRRGAPGQTLQATALLHEAYLQLERADQPRWNSRTHFCALASKVMRDVLVDQERARRRDKRGGQLRRVTLHTDTPGGDALDLDVMALHEALDELAEVDPRQARIVELRYFGGLTGDEIAATVEVSRRTVVRELAMAQAWLLRAMQGGEASS